MRGAGMELFEASALCEEERGDGFSGGNVTG